jgi:hypothetical protein
MQNITREAPQDKEKKDKETKETKETKEKVASCPSVFGPARIKTPSCTH